MNNMNCVFCAIVSDNNPHHEIVWQDGAHVAFLSIRPTAPGHTLVIPRDHVDYAFDLNAPAFGALMEASRKIAVPLKELTGAVRIGLAIDGFQVPHAHVHLVPVHQSGDLCLSPQDIAPEELRATGDRFRAAYASIP